MHLWMDMCTRTYMYLYVNNKTTTKKCDHEKAGQKHTHVLDG